MKNGHILLLFVVLILAFSSCATIVSKSYYPLVIKSTPPDADIVITNKKGEEVYTGVTPVNVKLAAGNGYFSKARYVIEFNRDGYDTKYVPVTFSLDGWYIGNILLGGIIGGLIVDPISGAMYKLDTGYINAQLATSSTDASNEVLRIYALDDIPVEWKNHLVEIID